MSGGSLNYFYSDMEDHVGDFDDMELDDLVRDLAKLFHDREWYLSADTNEGSWREARDSFKKKWFKGKSRQERIEKYLSDLKDQVFDSLGLSKAYCKNCEHWKPETEEGSEYGDCDEMGSCLMHRSEKCEKFTERKAKINDR